MKELRDLGRDTPAEGTTLDRIGAAARKAREFIRPWNLFGPADVASFAPGGGLVQAWQDSGRARDNLKAGNYGQAAADYGSMALNTLGEVLPALKMGMAMLPAAKVAGALPMDEAARAARASQMGFGPQTYYHATTADIDQFNLGHAGRGNTIGRNERAVFLTDSPAVADSYLPGQYINMASADAKTHGAADMGDGVGRYYGAGSQVMPLRVRGMDDFDVWDMGGGGYRPDQMSAMLKEAKRGGAPGVIFENIRDPGMMTANGPAGNPRKPSTVVAVFDPARIRSQFAQFDPAKIKSKDILASLATLGMLGYGASQREQGGQAPQM